MNRSVLEKLLGKTAIAAPRFHSSHTGHLQIEKSRFKQEVIEALSSMDFEVKRRGAYSFYLGCVQGVEVRQQYPKIFLGVADPRRDGIAKGPEKLIK